MGCWTTLYPPAPPYIKRGAPTLSHFVMRTAEFAGRAAARISQDEAAVDMIVVLQSSRRNWVSFYPLLTMLQLSLALVVCQSWDRVTGTWMSEWESGPGMPGWSCGDLLAGHGQSCLLCWGAPRGTEPGFACTDQEFSFHGLFHFL